MNAPARTENFGELGPAMRSLTEMQREFVRHLVTGKPGFGAMTRAARLAGYCKESKASTLSKHAHDLSRNPKIIAAITEEAKKVIRGVGYAEAVAAIMNMVRDPSHDSHARAVEMILSRADADEEGIEELRALRKLGTAREKLLELYGGNGLVRLERLEAADLERRAEKAKIIEGEVIEAEQ